MFKHTPKIILACLAATVLTIPATASAACSSDKNKSEHVTKASYSAPSIVGLASGSEDLSTLVAAVSAAGLVDTLDSSGPFTVFAPTNAAFEKLPEGTVATLVKPENKNTLTGILTYHVVSGEVKAADLLSAISENDGQFMFPTVNGDMLTASVSGQDVILTDSTGGISRITATNLGASNGVVHLIDRVVMPQS